MTVRRYDLGDRTWYPHHFYFPTHLDKLWSQVSSLLPPGTCLQFLSRIGLGFPTARRPSSNVANSRSRAFRESIYARQKVPTNLYEYALGGTRTHAIELRGNIAGTRMTCYTTGATVFFLIHHVRLTTPGRYYIIFMARRTA